MTPNLFLATQTLFSPHKWFRPSQKGDRPMRKTEHWDSPVPGIYEYIPGRGWYLVATDKEVPSDVDHDLKAPEDQSTPTPKNPYPNGKHRETIRMTQPVQVKYSKVLKRYLLAPDYEMRKKHGKVQSGSAKSYTAGFFRLDDGIAWVECWDENGEFIPGPYKLWCLDQHTGSFRHMLKGDDPSFTYSRQNSFDTEGGRRRSQDSRSTTYYRSASNSTRDGPSVSSSRANSIRTFTPSAPTSHGGSPAISRRNSPKRSPTLQSIEGPKRSPTIQLEEAKERLRTMAAEQARAGSRSRASSSEDGRGRTLTPAKPLPIGCQ